MIKNLIYNKLREAGLRITARKKIILTVLSDNSDYMLSSADIIGKIRPGSMDTVTVYRILQSLYNAGIIESSIDSQGVTKYKLCDSSPHHHMICTDCGRIINFPCSERFWEKYLLENKFTEEYHKIEIYGKCKECSLKAID